MTAGRYNEVVFAATHNSYAGVISRQLDAGVRFLELDVHDNEFTTSGYRIGHATPGDDVRHTGGNPAGDDLASWLRAVAGWSGRHGDHAPITIGLDLKDPLTDNPSYREGNLARLNAELIECLGERLFTPRDLGRGPWPTVEELRGRVIVVLSGHEGSRLAYRRDGGFNPAVAVDGRGRVVEVHDSGTGDLWYWTGELASGRVQWRRHGRYDTGQNPAVALGPDGAVVEVHEDESPEEDDLWYRLGHLTADLELEWTQRGGRQFPHEDNGRQPTVRFAGSGRVREVHRSESSAQHWYWNGELDLPRGAIVWTRDAADQGKTADPRFDKARDGSVRVWTGAHGAGDGETLLHSVDQGGPRRIRYEQVAFVEVQEHNDPSLEREGAWFFAATARSEAPRRWAQSWRLGGKVVRLWQFADVVQGTNPPASFPATDHPHAQWYVDYCASVGAVS